MPDDRNAVFLRRVVLRNYRNIATCDVRLGPLALLVGPNGAGKSSFVDAVRLVADALRHSMSLALGERGGADTVRRRANDPAESFGVRLEFRMDSRRGHLAFEIEPDGPYAWRFRREECAVVETDGQRRHYSLRNGVIESSDIDRPPPPAPQSLYLLRAASVVEFQPVYEALSSMSFYHLDPESIRRPAHSISRDPLSRDGSNLAGALARLADEHPTTKTRIERYLGAAVDGIDAVRVARRGFEDRVEFLQRNEEGRDAVWLDTLAMSDGTLCALGVLTALLQGVSSPSGPRLIGIEEPETSLHPNAVGVLVDSLREAAEHSQVLVTTHSGDLFEGDDIHPDEVFPVVAEGGVCRIGPMDGVARSAVAENPYTIGGLLRLGQLMPAEPAASLRPRPPALFGSAP